MKDKNQTICAIVAVGPDNVIGRDGVMPWHCVSDLYHFRRLTLHNPCVFGRVTFENLPIQPLPGRLNLVCSSSYKNEYKNGVFYAKSVLDAINVCSGASQIFICGGAGIYKYVLQNDIVDVMYLTKIRNPELELRIKSEPDKYTRFPIDVDTFFDSSRWNIAPITYPLNTLPTDKNATVAEFFKSVRLR